MIPFLPPELISFWKWPAVADLVLSFLSISNKITDFTGFNCGASTKAHPFQWSLCILFWSTGLWGLPVLSLSFKDISSTLYLTGESRLSPHAHTHSTFPRHFKGLLRCVAFWHLDYAYIYVRFKRRGGDWIITHILNIFFLLIWNIWNATCDLVKSFL